MNCFEKIAIDYLGSGFGRQGRVASGTSYLFDGADLVRFAIEWLERFDFQKFPS